MKRVFTLIAVLSAGVVSHAQIAPSRSIDWTKAGATVQARATVCATLAAGATTAQVDAAIAACPTDQVVKLGPGTFTLNGLTIARNFVTLRGSGTNQTLVLFVGGNGCVGLWTDVCVKSPAGFPSSDSPGTVASWTGGLAKGSTTATLSTVAGMSVGNVLVLDQLDDATDTGQVWVCQVAGVCASEGGAGGRAGRAQMQLVTVTGISGNVVTFTPAIHMPNWRASQRPEAWWFEPVRGVGIEDLSFDHVGSGTSVLSGIFFFNAVDSWVKNVRSLRANRNHIWLYESTRVTVRDSYFYGTLNAASQSYGVELRMGGDHLVENNIFQHVTTPLMTGNTTGTVWGYNFAIDDYYSVAAWQQASSYFHDAGVDHVLWESNDGIGFTSDNIHGTSNFGTAFRNYWHGREPGKTMQTSPIILMATSRYMNLVGNVLGTGGYHTNYECAPATTTTPSCGNGDVSIFTIGWSGNGGTVDTLPNDPRVKTTSYRWGNYDPVSASARFVAAEVPSGLVVFAQPVPTTQTLPPSLYLTAKPGFFGAGVWPAIGPDVTGQAVVGVAGHVAKIPARLCYEATSKTNDVLNFDANACYGAVVPTPPTTGQCTDGAMTYPTGTILVAWRVANGSISSIVTALPTWKVVSLRAVTATTTDVTFRCP